MYKNFFLLILFISASTNHAMRREIPANCSDSYQKLCDLLERAKQKKLNMKDFLETRIDDTNFTVLHSAADALEHEDAKLLLEHGADVDSVGGISNNTTPLMLAIQGCWAQPQQAHRMITLLCAHGAQVNWDMQYRLMQIRMLGPKKNFETISQCIETISAQRKRQEKSE